MRKNLVRIVALLLVVMLALTLLPMGALAAQMELYEEIYHSQYPTYDDWSEGFCPLHSDGSPKIFSHPITIKASEYEDLLWHYDELYELKGFVNWDDVKDNGKPIEFKSSISFDGKEDIWVSLGYALHTHNLSCWYSDGTTHWRECLQCGEDFMYQNWCQDGDEDGICNVCGGDVPYHDVTVIEAEGGKITVNEETAAHRTKITADVEPAEGYKLKQLHFVKVREDGSRQEITRRKQNGQFWTYMPTYDLEISAEFVKK